MLQCEAVKLPNYVLNGVNNTLDSFIGINPLIDLLTVMSQDMANVSTLQQNFQNIVNLDLPKVTQDALNQTDTYQSAFVNI